MQESERVLDMGGMIRAPVEIWPVTRTAVLVEQAYNALLADKLPDANQHHKGKAEYYASPT